MNTWRKILQIEEIISLNMQGMFKALVGGQGTKENEGENSSRDWRERRWVLGQVGTGEMRRGKADSIKSLAFTLNQIHRQPMKSAIIWRDNIVRDEQLAVIWNYWWVEMFNLDHFFKPTGDFSIPKIFF